MQRRSNGRRIGAVKTTGKLVRAQSVVDDWPRIYPWDDGYDEKRDWPGRKCAVKSQVKRKPRSTVSASESDSDSESLAMSPLLAPERRPALPRTDRGVASWVFGYRKRMDRLAEEFEAEVRERLEKIKKLEEDRLSLTSAVKMADQQHTFMPGEHEYDTVFAFRAEFLEREKVESVASLKYDDGEQLAERFREYISLRIDAELFSKVDADDGFWEGILMD